MKYIKDLLFEMKNPNFELAKTAEEQILIEFEDLLEQANKLEKALDFYIQWPDAPPTLGIQVTNVFNAFKKVQGIE